MMKKCSTCKQEKPVINFNKNKSTQSGFHNQCRDCQKLWKPKPEALARSRKKTREWNRFKLTGFTPSDFEKKLKEQNYKCGICETSDPGATNWHADHDHATGEKRGVLCHKCNTGLGLLKDDIDILCSAINYLKNYTK